MREDKISGIRLLQEPERVQIPSASEVASKNAQKGEGTDEKKIRQRL